MNLRWFTSKTVRAACVMKKHVQKMVNAQRDILSPQAIGAVEAAVGEINQAVRGGADNEALKKQMANLEDVANKWLKPYPNAVVRENIEVLLVALAVALGIRTFFLQPFKIPTGSMQPTLFGVMPSPGSLQAHNQPDLVIPGPLTRFFDFWFNGWSYFNVVAPENGQLQEITTPTHFLLFNLSQKYRFNDKWYTIWFPPDELFERAGYSMFPSMPIKAGDPIIRLKTVAGDHLFVDRLSYNFRHPERGEIVVFETKGIPGLPPDQFYIKRLVALPNEHVQIGNDRHLIIDGHRLDTNTPHFENVYNFNPNQPPRENQYSGHANARYVSSAQNPNMFDSADTVFTVRPDHYMVMGDNTMNSLDSRYWGDFPQTNIVGKYFFVYWPLSTRFGWSLK
jgi:signal peptidase I